MPAEEQLGFVSIVRLAPEFNVLNYCLATHAIRLHMVKLKEATLGAAAAVQSDKRALATVAEPDLAPDVGRNVTRVWVCGTTGPGSIGRGKFLLLKLPDQHFQYLRHHLAHVSIRNLMAQEVLGPAKQVMRLFAGRELDFVARRRQRNRHWLRGRTNFQGGWPCQRRLIVGGVSFRQGRPSLGSGSVSFRNLLNLPRGLVLRRFKKAAMIGWYPLSSQNPRAGFFSLYPPRKDDDLEDGFGGGPISLRACATEAHNDYERMTLKPVNNLCGLIGRFQLNSPRGEFCSVLQTDSGHTKWLKPAAGCVR
jgi:hypothetical protein